MAHKRKRKSKRRKFFENLVYKLTHRDFKTKSGGKPKILVLRNEGTTLVPVAELTNRELVARLPRR
jgi:hypothetical protein